MLRLTLILCIGMYASLMIAGVDRGQMRPGLAQAAKSPAIEWQADPVPADSASSPTTVASLPDANAATSEAPVETAAAQPVTEPAAPVVAEAVVAEAAAEDVMLADDAAAVAETLPERSVVTQLDEPIFSLASVGNEAVPGQVSGQVSGEAQARPEVADGGQGTIWYVNASSVNVRALPSTDAEIVGRLGSGEATLLVQAVDADWARIVIQGDGVEGFVAMRYLSAEAP